MKTIALSRGMAAKVDDEDVPLVSSRKWYAEGPGRRGEYYAASRTGGVPAKMHRIILGAPDGVQVDHVNGDTLDNRRENLRLCTRSQNAMHKHKPSGKRTSIYKGVSYDSAPRGRTKRWKMEITVKQRKVEAKYFLTEREAALAYNEAAKRYHGEFAILNVVR